MDRLIDKLRKTVVHDETTTNESNRFQEDSEEKVNLEDVVKIARRKTVLDEYEFSQDFNRKIRTEMEDPDVFEFDNEKMFERSKTDPVEPFELKDK